MNFLPDVYVKCDECDGKRYNKETLEVTYKGKNIYEVLEMTIEDACKFFENRPIIMRKLQTLYDVGILNSVNKRPHFLVAKPNV